MRTVRRLKLRSTGWNVRPSAAPVIRITLWNGVQNRHVCDKNEPHWLLFPLQSLADGDEPALGRTPPDPASAREVKRRLGRTLGEAARNRDCRSAGPPTDLDSCGFGGRGCGGSAHCP